MYRGPYASRFEGLSRGAIGSTSAITSSIGLPAIAVTCDPIRASYGARAAVIVSPSLKRQKRSG